MSCRLLKNSVGAIAALMLVACSHGVKRVDYPVTTSPTEVLQTLGADIQNGYSNQTDVLARSDFEKAVDYFQRAEADMRDRQASKNVLETLGYARAYLDRAEELANGRRQGVQGVLDSRKAALDAGLRQYPRLSQDFNSVDEDLSEAAAAKKISPETFAGLQARYMALELKSVQSRHLEGVRGKIEGAKATGASRRAPMTLRKAEMAYVNAQNRIASHLHDETVYLPSVLEANQAADLLVNVMAKVKSDSTILPESVALRLVNQEQGLTELKDQLKSKREQISESTEIISAQDQQLKATAGDRSAAAALAMAREEFTPKEADVYRDGDNLLIRIKAIHFSSGRAELPTASIPLLGKVKVIAEEMNPLRVVIEGHTDSTGSVRNNNLLSQKRAEAVVEYLVTAGFDRDKIQAIGYGSSKPIADNKTIEGRAQNRRVDVVITPSRVEAAPTTSM